MHLEDPMELRYSDFSVAAEAVPMIDIVCLSDIWLPSHLLPSRGKFPDPCSNDPGIFRTLAKPDVTDCFSTYSDSSLQNNESGNNFCVEDECSDNSSDGFSKADMLDILNDYSSTIDTAKKSPYKENFISHSVPSIGSKQPQNFDNSCEDNLGQDECSVAEETGLKDSLEEVYNSEENLNGENYSGAFQREFFNNLCDDATNTLQFIQENQLNILPSGCEVAVVQNSDSLKDSDLVDGFTTEKLEIDNAQNSCVEDPNSVLIECSLAYQKPAIEETVGKQKKQRDRKKKKAQKKNRLLDAPQNNLLFGDGCSHHEPEVDEFYEHVMRKKCIKSYESEYPSFYEESQIKFRGSAEKINSLDKTTTGFWEDNSISTTAEVIYEQNATWSSNELKMIKDKDLPQPTNENENVHTIVIEYIPLDVTKEQLHSILMNYGELKKISLKPCRGFLKAELKMDFNCDVDWIIESLNGSQLFGTTTDVLKCYKLC